MCELVIGVLAIYLYSVQFKLTGSLINEMNFFFKSVDVEQEVNGLYTFDRKAKLKPELVEDINRRAKKLYLESVDPKGLSRHLRTFKHMVQGKV